MSGLINVDILLNKAWDADNGFGWEKVVSIKDVMDAPTIDAVPVVRCKDCYWHNQCRFEQELGLEGFCSKGERREDGKQ